MPERVQIQVQSPPPGAPDKLEQVKYDSGAQHVYEVDDQGNKRHISHDAVLQDYNHNLVPGNIVRRMKKLDDPNLPQAEKDQAQQEIANWQNQYRDDWLAANPEYAVQPPAPGEAVDLTALEQQIAQLNERVQQLPEELQQLIEPLRQLVEQNTQILQQILAQLAANQQILQQVVVNQAPAQPPAPVPAPPAPGPVPTPPAPVPPVPAPAPPVPPPAPAPGPGPAPAPPGPQPNQQPQQQTPEQQAVAAAEAELNDARNYLLELTIRRKARAGDGLTNRRREDAQDYEVAMSEYTRILDNLLTARRALLRAETPNISNEDIARALTREAFAEQRRFEEQQVELNNQHLNELGWTGKLLRSWANLSTRKKIAIGLLVGGATAVTSGALGLGLAGLAVGSAAKFSLGLLNRRASLRNVSEHSRDRTLDTIERDMRRILATIPGLHLGGDPDLENYQGGLVTVVENDYDGRVQFAQRRNRIGNAVLVASGAVGALGVTGELGVLPNPNWDVPGWPFGGDNKTGGPIPYDGGPKGMDDLMNNFHPNSFSGRTPHEAVENMFRDVIENGNNIEVRSLTDSKIDQIAQEMMDKHWHIASGMESSPSGLRQHIVDAAKDWADGQTSNADASALQGLEKVNGSSVESWQRFMELAQKHGVSFRKGG